MAISAYFGFLKGYTLQIYEGIFEKFSGSGESWQYSITVFKKNPGSPSNSLPDDYTMVEFLRKIKKHISVARDFRTNLLW